MTHLDRPLHADDIAEAIQNSTYALVVNSHEDLLAALDRIARADCEYTGSAGCNLLPEGVRRSVCNPCFAQAAINNATQRTRS